MTIKQCNKKVLNRDFAFLNYIKTKEILYVWLKPKSTEIVHVKLKYQHLPQNSKPKSNKSIVPKQFNKICTCAI